MGFGQIKPCQRGPTIVRERYDEAYERLLKSDVKYRFVIDMASLK